MTSQQHLFKVTLSLPKLLLCMLILLFGSTGCGFWEFRDQQQKLKPFVERRAPKSELVSSFGDDFLLYAKGATNWQHLTKFLEDESPHRWVALRELSAKWPTVMLYSTPDMMTWFFLDSDDRVVDFLVGAQ